MSKIKRSLIEQKTESRFPRNPIPACHLIPCTMPNKSNVSVSRCCEDQLVSGCTTVGKKITENAEYCYNVFEAP